MIDHYRWIDPWEADESLCKMLVSAIAETDWDPIELGYDALNVRYARGSLSKELRQSAAAAIKTLRIIIADAREISKGE